MSEKLDPVGKSEGSTSGIWTARNKDREDTVLDIECTKGWIVCSNLARVL